MKSTSDVAVAELSPASAPDVRSHEAFAANEARARSSFEADIERSRDAHSRRAGGLSPRNHRLAMLMGYDALAIATCTLVGFGLASLTRSVLDGHAAVIQPHSSPYTALVFLLPALLTFWQSWRWGHYTRFRPVWTELRELLKLALYIAAVDAVLLYALQQTFSRLWLASFIASFCVLVPFGRHLARRSMIRRGTWFKSTWVVGTGDNAAMTAAALESDAALGHRVDGFVDLSEGALPGRRLMGKPLRTSMPDMASGTDRETPCIVFALESMQELGRYRRVLNRTIARSAVAMISPPVSGLPLYGAEIVDIFRHDTVLLKLQNNIASRSARFAKRGTDLLLSAAALVMLSPLFAVLAWLTVRDGGPAIYGHRRIGRGGREFSCLKFRTMVIDADERLRALLAADPAARAEWDETQKLVDDPRITPVGRFLRATSLDELPQLINVLRGDMSLVGPRPIVRAEMSRYDDYLPYYLAMVPGITGLWQSSGRSDTSYRERVLLDVWYARNWCPWHDLVILLRTFPSLVNRVGAR